MDGKKVIDVRFKFLYGLTHDQRIIDAAIAATRKYGTGCAGSRLLNGTLDIHVELEKELAEFVGKDEALCFSTGFTVNEGVIPQLAGRGDTSFVMTVTMLLSWTDVVFLLLPS